MKESEAWRRETEAREWLRRLNNDPERIREMLERVERKRGKEAAEVLRQDMRDEFRRARSGAASE